MVGFLSDFPIAMSNQSQETTAKSTNLFNSLKSTTKRNQSEFISSSLTLGRYETRKRQIVGTKAADVPDKFFNG